MVELVDTPDLGSGSVRCESSSLSEGTRYIVIYSKITVGEVFYPLK